MIHKTKPMMTVEEFRLVVCTSNRVSVETPFGNGKIRRKMMTVTLESLGIDQLSVSERLSLIEQIWDSLPISPAASDLPASHLAELARRRSELDALPGEGKPWREVLDDLEQRP